MLSAKSPNGTYKLNETSSVTLMRGRFAVDKVQTDELVSLMNDDAQIPKTLNLWGKYNFRKTATFGGEYSFSRQKNIFFDTPVDHWPTAVQRALTLAKNIATEKGMDPNLYNVVHVNYYQDGNVGIDPHTDDERSLVAGAPIISVTLLDGTKIPRSFQIYNYKEIKPNDKIAEIDLNDGDVLVMEGEMQKYFKHGVLKKISKVYKNARRINLTVRAMKSIKRSREGV